MSESYLQLVSATTGPIAIFVVSAAIALTVLAVVAFVSAIVLFVRKGACGMTTGCFAICALLCVLGTILCALIDPHAAVSRYIGDKPIGTITVIETRETARGTEVESFEVALDAYPNDPTIIVNDCEFDKMPEIGERIEFVYETSRQPFDGEQVHVVMTNWWDAE